MVCRTRQINGNQSKILGHSSYRPPSKCSHYGLEGHSKNRCFKLIGYPSNWDKTRDPRYDKSRALIAEVNVASDHIGNNGKALNVSASVTNSFGTLNLDYVLVVSFLDYNLLSIAQITVTLHCLVIF